MILFYELFIPFPESCSFCLSQILDTVRWYENTDNVSDVLVKFPVLLINILKDIYAHSGCNMSLIYIYLKYLKDKDWNTSYIWKIDTFTYNNHISNIKPEIITKKFNVILVGLKPLPPKLHMILEFHYHLGTLRCPP